MASDLASAEDCVLHVRIFFNRPDFDLASAKLGSFALVPGGDMLDRLRRDYEAMSVMIFGDSGLRGPDRVDGGLGGEAERIRRGKLSPAAEPDVSSDPF